MPREDQPVVRSSVEAHRIWKNVYLSNQVDENFHPITPHPPLIRIAQSPPSTPTDAHPSALPPIAHHTPLPFQRQNTPSNRHWAPYDTREVERRVFREALKEVDENRVNEVHTLRIQVQKLKHQRDVLLRANTILSKCMEKMTL